MTGMKTRKRPSCACANTTSPAQSGSSTPAPLDPARLRRDIVRVAEQEHARWNRPVTLKETDPRVWSTLADYWLTGVGRRVRPADLGSAEFQNKHYCSAAFISWVMRTAGAGPAFCYSASHSNYVVAARNNRLRNNGNPFRAYRVSEARPQVGDLVCKRRDGSGATYDTLQCGMPTHCDVVVAVGPRAIQVIGGNVNNTVWRRPIPLTADGRLAPPQYFAVVKVERPGTPAPLAPTPAVPLTEAAPLTPTPGGQTLYAPIDLGIVENGGRVRPQTGIFIPDGWRPGPRVSVVLYCHGMRRSDRSVAEYWNPNAGARRNLREQFAAAGKNALLVLPLLGKAPQRADQVGSLARDGGLDEYLRRVLAAVQATGRLGAGATIGTLILAGHSAGGKVMRMITAASNAADSAAAAVWGFDCTYYPGDETAWPDWARRHPDSQLVLRYIKGSPTAWRSERAKANARGLPNVDVLPSPTGVHERVPLVHFGPLVQASPRLDPV